MGFLGFVGSSWRWGRAIKFLRAEVALNWSGGVVWRHRGQPFASQRSWRGRQAAAQEAHNCTDIGRSWVRVPLLSTRGVRHPPGGAPSLVGRASDCNLIFCHDVLCAGSRQVSVQSGPRQQTPRAPRPTRTASIAGPVSRTAVHRGRPQPPVRHTHHRDQHQPPSGAPTFPQAP